MSNKAELRADLQKAMTIALDVVREAQAEIAFSKHWGHSRPEEAGSFEQLAWDDGFAAFLAGVEHANPTDSKDRQILQNQLTACSAAKSELAEALRHLLHNIKATGKRPDLGLAVVAAESALRRNGCGMIAANKGAPSDDELLRLYTGESYEFTKRSLVAYARKVLQAYA